jgi:ribosome-binding protein aMBF1 (putative translation factor)
VSYEKLSQIISAAANVVVAYEAGDTASTEVHMLREALEALDPDLVANAEGGE